MKNEQRAEEGDFKSYATECNRCGQYFMDGVQAFTHEIKLANLCFDCFEELMKPKTTA